MTSTSTLHLTVYLSMHLPSVNIQHGSNCYQGHIKDAGRAVYGVLLKRVLLGANVTESPLLLDPVQISSLPALFTQYRIFCIQVFVISASNHSPCLMGVIICNHLQM